MKEIAMAEIKEPLPLPEGFNPETNMIAKVTENGTFHESLSARARRYQPNIKMERIKN